MPTAVCQSILKGLGIGVLYGLVIPFLGVEMKSEIREFNKHSII